MNFLQEVYKLSLQIPKGKITTYKEIAKGLGSENSARAVGNAMANNPYPFVVPCHRVVHSDGDIRGFGLGNALKIKMLKEEGVEVKNNKVDLRKFLFKNFSTNYPLKKLREEQIQLAKKIILKDDFKELKIIGGADVSYLNDISFSAIVSYDYKTKEIIEEKVVKSKVNFPYIPTFLSYREYPLIEKAFKSLNKKPSLLVIDGNGVLHPLGIGTASYIGLLLNVPTIGVAKSLLCGKEEKIDKKDISKFLGKLGEIDEKLAKVVYKNKLIGFAYYSAKKPIYISPGHRISFQTALKITKEFCKYRLPEMIRIADMKAKEEKLKSANH